MIAGLLGLPLLLLGGFGLASAYFPGTDLLHQIYGVLEAANLALIDAGQDLPRDAWQGLEELAAGPILRFVIAPLGVVLLVVAAGVGMSPGAPAPKKSKSTSKEESDDLSIPTDKRTRKKILKEAAVLRKNGELVEAAELLWSHKEVDKAYDYFMEGDHFTRAAEIRHDQNRFVDSAELYIQAGEHENAGAIFAHQEEWGRAGECYEKADSLSVAAEMYDKAEEYLKAATCYQAVEFHRHAASAFVKVKDWLRAAECLYLVFTDEAPRAKSDAKKLAELQKLASQAGKLFRRAGKTDRAKDILERAECWDEAAQIALSMEHYAEAAEYFRNSGDLIRAADALGELGESEAAARILGEYHRDRGELAEAAAKMEEAGDFAEAGDLYRQLESYDAAGACYAKLHDFAAAAEMYRISGDRGQAAECYERSGRFTEAAECYALEGVPEREADMLDKAGEHLKAGEVYHREGDDEAAITILQKIEPESPDFSAASALLGDIFRSRGQLSLAIKKLRQSIGEAELDRENVPVYYILATILEANEQVPEAVEIYEKVMSLDYHYEDVERRLIECRDRIQAGGPVQDVGADPTAGTAGSGTVRTAAPAGQPGRYQIVGELGRGGMGIVYKAKDTVLDRVVAFKVLPDSFKENQQALSNFLREAQAAAKLNHPNIVTVYDTGEQDGRYYIAMEYVDGTTLKEILRRRGVISPAGILHVMVQICEALAYAHEKKVVHRDIKPANAMWTRDKKAKIMDFGLAKLIEEVRNHTTVVAGTPYYMSPEQTLGKNVDHRTDIYSLGVTIFEMATGTVPFKEGNIPYHHVHTPAPDVRRLRPELPVPLAAIVNRCLAKDPADRYQSTREILAEIRGCLTNAQSNSETSP
jgi:tetratricopeptide (TPR) repeat protein